MNFSPRKFQKFGLAKKTTIFILSVVFFFVSFQSEVFGQKKFSKSYPATKNIRLELINRSGTVTVEGWNKDEVRISAVMENSSTNILPQNLSGRILINLKKDNQGNDDVGYANFNIKVPYSSTVFIETMVGNLNVSNVNGGLVRAHITTEGDITLTNISAASVSAENVIGDIFFDGEVQGGGTYRFVSTRGNINLRIPFRSSFRCRNCAFNPQYFTRFIFNGGMSFGDGRRITGRVGDGSASLIVTNLRGNISFISR